jgi:streptogramin lyase
MCRPRRVPSSGVIRAVALATLVAAVSLGSTSGVGLSQPAKPLVSGPHATTDRTPTFRFASKEAGFPSRSIVFRCAVDTSALHSCPRSYTTPSLRIGRHKLSVIAVDPDGRRSQTTIVYIRIVTTSSTASPTRTTAVGEAPYNVACGFGSLWAAVRGAITRIDPATGAIRARIAIGGRPWGIAIGDSDVFVGNQFTHSIAVVDPAANSVSRRIALDGDPVGVAVGGGFLWAASFSDDRVWRVDPTSGEVLSVEHVSDVHEFIGYSEGRVWVGSEDGTVAQLDSGTGAVSKRLSVGDGGDVDYLGFSPGSVWVSAYRTAFLWRIDAATGTVAQRVLIGRGAQGVQDDGRRIWVAMYKANQVLEVNRATGKIEKRITVAREPRGVTLALGRAWTANSGSNTVSRITPNR